MTDGAMEPDGAPAADATDPVGAFCRHARARITGAPRGALGGLTFAAKDVFAIEGIAACCGNPTWLATHRPADHTAAAVTALVRAGATLVGLTLTDELALSLTGENHHYGAPINVRCRERVSGGSSSGSAAAVAAGLCDFALGTDTGGSVRVPASHCGLFGFRPSHGAVDARGVWALAPRFDTVGWFAPDAATLARVGDVLLPRAPAGDTAAAARMLLPEEAEVAPLLDPGAFAVFTRAARELAQRHGVPLSPARVGGERAPIASWVGTYLTLQNAEAAGLHRAWIERERPAFGSLIARRFARGLEVTRDDHARAEPLQAALRAQIGALLADGSWLAWPSAAGAAPLRGLDDDAVDENTGRALTLSALASLGGLPQISLPVGAVDGCPFGVSLIGPRGSDRALLAAARAIVVERRADNSSPTAMKEEPS